MQSQIDINDVLKAVEISPGALSFIKLPYQQAVKGLDDFKSFIQKKKKKLAFRYHPDKGGDEQRMKEINQAIDLLMTLEVMQVRPRPMVQYYASYQYYYTGNSSATNSTATSWTGGW